MAIFRGTPRADTYAGTDSNDTIYGRAADDSLQGGNGDDLVDGGQGNDVLQGGEGINDLRGRQGNDYLAAAGSEARSLNILRGDRGNDTLEDYGSGYARMEGGTGNDTLTVVAGRESINQSAELFLGRGADTVQFMSEAGGTAFSQAHVRDFAAGDHIALFADDGSGMHGTAELFAQMDGDHNGVLDGTDTGTDFAHAFKLGTEFGMVVNGDVLVIQLAPGTEALTATDFML
jgi:Ca2+-binding RTX toxin-like protein